MPVVKKSGAYQLKGRTSEINTARLAIQSAGTETVSGLEGKPVAMWIIGVSQTEPRNWSQGWWVSEGSTHDIHRDDTIGTAAEHKNGTCNIEHNGDGWTVFPTNPQHGSIDFTWGVIGAKKNVSLFCQVIYE